MSFQDLLLEPTESIRFHGFITLLSEDIGNDSSQIVDEKGEVVEDTVGSNSGFLWNLEGENWIWASERTCFKKPVVFSGMLMQTPQRTYKPVHNLSEVVLN